MREYKGAFLKRKPLSGFIPVAADAVGGVAARRAPPSRPRGGQDHGDEEPRGNGIGGFLGHVGAISDYDNEGCPACDRSKGMWSERGFAAGEDWRSL